MASVLVVRWISVSGGVSLGGTGTMWRGTWCGGGSAAFHTHSNETFRQIACDQCLSPSRIDGDTERTISRVMRNLLGL
jgi:hypothetical protein